MRENIEYQILKNNPINDEKEEIKKINRIYYNYFKSNPIIEKTFSRYAIIKKSESSYEIIQGVYIIHQDVNNLRETIAVDNSIDDFHFSSVDTTPSNHLLSADFYVLIGSDFYLESVLLSPSEFGGVVKFELIDNDNIIDDFNVYNSISEDITNNDNQIDANSIYLGLVPDYTGEEKIISIKETISNIEKTVSILEVKKSTR